MTNVSNTTQIKKVAQATEKTSTKVEAPKQVEVEETSVQKPKVEKPKKLVLSESTFFNVLKQVGDKAQLTPMAKELQRDKEFQGIDYDTLREALWLTSIELTKNKKINASKNNGKGAWVFKKI